MILRNKLIDYINYFTDLLLIFRLLKVSYPLLQIIKNVNGKKMKIGVHIKNLSGELKLLKRKCDPGKENLSLSHEITFDTLIMKITMVSS